MEVAPADPTHVDLDARPRWAWQRRLVGVDERGGEARIGKVVLDGAQSAQPTPPPGHLLRRRASDQPLAHARPTLRRGPGVRAARCNEYGPPESLTVEDVPEPTPRRG